MNGDIKQKDDALIKLWNRLEGMWFHDNDGSTFVPVPKEFQNYYDPKLLEKQKKYGNESLLFDIVFNEIRHDIEKAVSQHRRKELK